MVLEIAGSTTRYEVLRRIGAGGMGVVYEAEDRERGQKVALKTFTSTDPEKLVALKREFRGLADLSHPNLVALYDLVAIDGTAFFTMELLDGVDLMAHLWDRTSVREQDPAFAETQQTPPRGAAGHINGDEPTVAPLSTTTPCNIKRLRAALPQLARGLRALHVAGMVHRDVKPSNIRVTEDGRVVLLDFGLVAEVEPKRNPAEAGLIVGTVAYMAPEQCAGDVPITPAADWYAVGVVLFYALTGRFPFDGPPARVLLEKQTKPAVRPSHLVKDIPQDLDDLCAELLEREPTDRPSGVPLLRNLGDADDSGRIPTASLSREGGFAGREAELALLEQALEPLAHKRASIAIVRAPSGLGKSTLVSRFLERVRATREDVLILRGRCLEREDVPYKAIDPLIDDLSDWWMELPPKEAQALLPRDAHLLSELFPVLDRVRAIADAPRGRAIADPQARRTLAFGALRETLQRLGDRHRVVLFLDDMQWVDRDTAALLADVMRAPDPPPLLLVLATRVDGSEPVLELVERMDAATTLVDVPPLSEEAAVRARDDDARERRDRAPRRRRGRRQPAVPARADALPAGPKCRKVRLRRTAQRSRRGARSVDRRDRRQGPRRDARGAYRRARRVGPADRRDGRDRGRAADPPAAARRDVDPQRRAVAPAPAAARTADRQDVGLARRRHDRAVSRSRAPRGDHQRARRTAREAPPRARDRAVRQRHGGAARAPLVQRRRRRPRGHPRAQGRRRGARQARLRPVRAVVRDRARGHAVERHRAARAAHPARRLPRRRRPPARRRRSVPRRQRGRRRPDRARAAPARGARRSCRPATCARASR